MEQRGKEKNKEYVQYKRTNIFNFTFFNKLFTFFPKRKKKYFSDFILILKSEKVQKLIFVRIEIESAMFKHFGFRFRLFGIHS